MTKKLSIAAICLFLITSISAQKVSSVVSIEMNNIQPIKKGDEITGYFMFYKADKVKGGDYSYKIRILDENAEKVATKKIVGGSLFYLLEAQYNGDLLCFKFYDMKEKKINLKFYNDKAEKVYSKSYEVSKQERRMIMAYMQQGSQANPSVVPIEGKGFVDLSVVKNDKIGYELKFYPNDRETKGWKYGSKKTSPLLEFASITEANEDVVIVMVGMKKSMMKQDAEYKIVALDAKTGKEMYDIKVSNSRYEESITNTFYDETKNELTTFGYYFKKGDNVVKDKSLGIVISTLDASGKKIDTKYTGWTKDIAKHLGPSNRGKIADVGFIFFHEFIRKADGSFYGIGESYRKTVSAGGTALKVLAAAGGGASNTSAAQITVNDFYIFEFDKDKNVIGVETFEKSKSRVILPAGAAYYGPQLLAQLVKSMGGFDFDYLKSIDNGQTFALFYRNHEKIKGEKNKSIAGVISHTKGNYMTDKIDIPTESDAVRTLPAKDGNILFLEYFRKDRKLEMNFKKMNY